MVQIISLAVPLVLVVLELMTLLPLLTGWVHPLRVLSTTLSSAFTLLLLSLIVPLVGVAAWIWGALLLLTLLAAVLASVRTLRTPPPAAAPEPGQSRRERRQAKHIGRLASRPSWIELAVTALLFLAVLAAAALAG